MPFNTLIFICFLPLVFLFYWVIPAGIRKYWLLLSSYLFYFYYEPWCLLLLAGTSCLDYYLSQLISNSKDPQQKKFILIAGLIVNIGILAAFKYAVFARNIYGDWSEPDSLTRQLIIPAGLSFYTFQSLSYLIDVYRGQYKARDTLWDFLLYVSFFPHMVAGPIVRANILMPQLKAIHYFKSIDWAKAAQLCIWGYFKKMVIADNISPVVEAVFHKPSHFSGLEIIGAGLLFAVQIYCDFSGYSDIATGVSKFFKINLSINWNRPFFALSVRDFWRRYHISLSSWLRDYVYHSLGGNRVSGGRWLFNILLVFLLSGFWHGSNFTYLTWGAILGGFYVLEAILKTKFPAVHLPVFLARFYTLGVHVFALLAFRANTVSDMFSIYGQLFRYDTSYWRVSELIKVKGYFHMYLLLFLTLLLLLKEGNEEYNWLTKKQSWPISFKPLFYLLVLACIFILGDFSANTFIYFQF